ARTVAMEGEDSQAAGVSAARLVAEAFGRQKSPLEDLLAGTKAFAGRYERFTEGQKQIASPALVIRVQYLLGVESLLQLAHSLAVSEHLQRALGRELAVMDGLSQVGRLRTLGKMLGKL